MRKLATVTILTLALSTSALAAPPSSDPDRGPIDRIVRAINRIIRIVRPLGDIGTITPPIPH